MLSGQAVQLWPPLRPGGLQEATQRRPGRGGPCEADPVPGPPAAGVQEGRHWHLSGRSVVLYSTVSLCGSLLNNWSALIVWQTFDAPSRAVGCFYFSSNISIIQFRLGQWDLINTVELHWNGEHVGDCHCESVHCDEKAPCENCHILSTLHCPLSSVKNYSYRPAQLTLSVTTWTRSRSLSTGAVWDLRHRHRASPSYGLT